MEDAWWRCVASECPAGKDKIGWLQERWGPSSLPRPARPAACLTGAAPLGRASTSTSSQKILPSHPSSSQTRTKLEQRRQHFVQEMNSAAMPHVGMAREDPRVSTHFILFSSTMMNFYVKICFKTGMRFSVIPNPMLKLLHIAFSPQPSERGIGAKLSFQNTLPLASLDLGMRTATRPSPIASWLASRPAECFVSVSSRRRNSMPRVPCPCSPLTN
jgi:hypothetical protein